MEHLPVSINIKDKHCLVIGGGEIAARKAGLFIKAGAIVTVIAPKIEAEMKHHLSHCNVVWDVDTFSAEAMSHIPTPKYVVSAAGDDAVNQAVYRYCQQHNIPVNVVERTETEYGDFIFSDL
ncbi:bifunctional precorrin-2 dehydrogenase/sirohydrochlorin ferrochelatase [Thiomicrorhabdus sp.]|uniref:precorrin-2 dehydrogenase/sirohydrochlorin ferrochelatase family protein n=1 Tax=Thiomicrorhabdus sp. TaxID=2039724 RepID=UPI00356259B0